MSWANRFQPDLGYQTWPKSTIEFSLGQGQDASSTTNMNTTLFGVEIKSLGVDLGQHTCGISSLGVNDLAMSHATLVGIIWYSVAR